MKPKIVHARDYKVMAELAGLFEDSKYKVKAQDKNFILLKKNNYGNVMIHLPFLLIALFFSALALIVNVVYFAYSVFQKSNVILITTEKLDENGNPLEFDDVSEIEVFYDQATWDKAIELSRLE